MSDFVHPHYTKAPIAEALIDIRISNPDSVSIDDLSRVADSLAAKFPNRQPIRHFEVGFQAELAGAGTAQFVNNQSQTGWRLISKEQDRVLQLQRIGFTYSHLPPYSDWENFRDGAREAWNAFRNVFAKEQASRVAVRVINKIPTSHETFPISDYVNIIPAMPASLPPEITASFVQVQIDLPRVLPDARAILNMASGQLDGTGPHITLDIDLFVERGIEGDEETWSILEKFGIEKDIIFEACITDKTRDIIK